MPSVSTIRAFASICGHNCNVEVRRLELEHLSLKFGEQSEQTTLIEQVGLFGAS